MDKSKVDYYIKIFEDCVNLFYGTQKTKLMSVKDCVVLIENVDCEDMQESFYMFYGDINLSINEYGTLVGSNDRIVSILEKAMSLLSSSDYFIDNVLSNILYCLGVDGFDYIRIANIYRFIKGFSSTNPNLNAIDAYYDALDICDFDINVHYKPYIVSVLSNLNPSTNIDIINKLFIIVRACRWSDYKKILYDIISIKAKTEPEARKILSEYYRY